MPVVEAKQLTQTRCQSLLQGKEKHVAKPCSCILV